MGRTPTSAAARIRTTASSAASARSRRARTTRCKVVPGCLSTKGGPRTDGDGRVRSIAGNGSVIEGLYAVGNCSASAFGMAYPGAGGTLGQGLMFGFRAGDAAAAD